MKTSDIKKLGEAWRSVTSSQVELEDLEETKKEDIDPKLMAKAADAKQDKADGKQKPIKGKDDAKKTAPVTDKDDDGEGMDPVGKEDDDIDNDGDSDSTDKYLKKRRKAIGKAMDKEEEPAESKKESVEEFDFNDLLIIEEQAEEEGIDLTVLSEAQLQELSPALLRRARAAADQKWAQSANRADKAKFHRMKSTDKFEKERDKRYHQTKKFEKGAGDAAQRDFEKRYADDKLKNRKEIGGKGAKDDARTKQDRTSVRHMGASQAFIRYKKKGGNLDRDAYMKKYHGAGQIGGVNTRNTYESYQHESTELIKMLEAAAKGARPQDKDATEPEGIDSKMSGKEKEFADKHKGKSDKKVEDNYEDGVNKTTKAGADATKAKSGKRPQDNQSGDKTAPGNPVKEDVDMDVKEGSISLIDAARAALMGKTVGEMQMMIDKEKKKAAKQDEDKNPYDGRLKTAKSFLERMNKKHGYSK